MVKLAASVEAAAGGVPELFGLGSLAKKAPTQPTPSLLGSFRERAEFVLVWKR